MRSIGSNHNEQDRIPEAVNNYTISTLPKLSCVVGIIKKLGYYLRLKDNADVMTLTKERGEHLSDERVKEYREILEKHNILIVVDNEMVEMQSKILGAGYAAGSFGNIIAFRSWQDLEQRNHLVRHEIIHSKQMQDLGGGITGFIKWLAIGGRDFLKILYQYKGIVPWASDHATSNQLTDRETYLNQRNQNYLSNREPNRWLSFVDQSVKNQLVDSFMKKELDTFLQQNKNINWYKQTTAKNLELTYNFIKDLQNQEHDLGKQQELQEIHQNDNRHQMITYGSVDKFAYKTTPQEHQLHFISEKALRKKIGLDAFMSYYGTANNYEKGSQKYLENKSMVDPIVEQFVKTNDIKILKQQLLRVYKNIEGYI